MKNTGIRLPGTFLLACSCIPLFSQESGLEAGGQWMTDQRIFTGKPHYWSWSENRLDLELTKGFSDRANFSANIWLRSFGFPVLTSSEQLFNKNETSPWNADFREAWIDLYGFLLPGLDVRIGRQVITWGRGDGINPTRVLNPADLEDIWDFGRVHGVEAIKLDYYLSNDFFLEGVFVPFFRPSTLPRGELSGIFSSGIDLPVPPGTQLTVMSDTLLMPENRPGQSAAAGIKLGGFLLGFDFSLSYAFFRDGLPSPSTSKVSVAGALPNLAVQTELEFPRFHMAGADFAGSLAGLGIWGELAMLYPEKEGLLTIDLSGLAQPDMERTVLEKKPFFRYLLGADYTFRGGAYINFQFLHGFFHEKGKEQLNDYLLLEFEKKFFGDRLSVSPVSGAFVAGNWKDLKNDHVWIWIPSLAYRPNDNTEIGLGVRIISGKGENIFSGLDNRDECFLKLVHYF